MGTDHNDPETSRPASARLQTGQKVFNRYTLKRSLGQGGMGVVWLARDEKLEQDVALKFLSETMLHDPRAVDRLKRETRHSLKLTHPNIIRIYDFVEDEASAAIAMEYVDGWSLWAMKVDRPHQCFSVEEITPWIRQLCAALDYAHAEGKLVHRDLKPGNLLIDARNQIKVSDFGIAHGISGAAGAETTTHPILGTIGYMSPQQAMGDAPSVLDDVYSLGATIYDLLTGTPPFYKGEVLAQVRELTPPTISERMHERGIADVFIPWHWEEVVAACLSKEPEKRPQSAGEVWRKLEMPGTARIASVQHGEEPVAPGKSNSGKIALVSAVIIFVAALAFAGWKWRETLLGKVTQTIASIKTAMAGGESIPAGSVDATFDPLEGPDTELRCLAIQPDGKILVGGAFKSFNNNHTKFGVTRLNPDGTLDPTFLGNAQGTVHAIFVQSNGQILIGGDFGYVRHTKCRTVARLNVDGTLDGNFDPGAGGKGEVRSLAQLSDGKILVGGHFTSFNGVPRSRVVRLNEDGSVDTDFTLGLSDVLWAITLQQDGKILMAGNFVHGKGEQARVMRRNADRMIDSSFKTPGGPNDIVYAIAPQPDGKIVIGGKFGKVNGVARNQLARLNADGTLDSSFIPALGDGSVQGIAVQRDGKVVIGGTFANIAGTICKGVARLNADGTLDKSFEIGSGANSFARAVALQPDGKIVVAGGFVEVNGVPRRRIARLHAVPAKGKDVVKMATATSKGSDWIVLFEGKSADAWRGYNRPSFPSAAWKVENGALKTVADVTPSDKCDLVTKEKFRNFELELEWRVLSGGANSGIKYRVVEGSRDAWRTAPEFQILDEAHPEEQIPRRSTGSVYDLLAPKARVASPSGDLNETRIVVKGDSVEHWLNGTKILEYGIDSSEMKKLISQSKFKDEPRFMQEKEGHIVLQNHTGEVEFWNIRIRRLAD